MVFALSATSLSAIPDHVLPSIFLPKPQGYYTMHYRRPYQDYKYRCAQPATVALTASYQASRKSDEIARALFGASAWRFTGSEVVGRLPQDLLADNFGLAPDFVGSVRFCPSTKAITLDLSYKLELPSFTTWCDWLYIELAAPLVHARWNLQLCEMITQPGMSTFPRCMMGNGSSLQPAQTIGQVLGGDFVITGSTSDLQVPWYHGWIVAGEQHITRLADISVALGSTLYHGAWEQAGCTVRTAVLTLMPTGNTYAAQQVFQPIVGNGGRWELGATVEAHGWWEPAVQHHLGIYGVATGTHLFSKLQPRIFDFTANGPLSRYLLLKEYTVVTVANQFTYPYAGILSNAINFTTRCCEVSCPFQGDITVQATYGYKHLQWDLGYNFYGRTAEHLYVPTSSLPSELEGYAFAPKGTEGTCYRLYDTNGNPTITQELAPVSLNSAQEATIHGPGMIMAPQPVVVTNPADQVALTWSSNNNNANIIGQSIDVVTASATYQVPQTSNPPRFLTRADLDLASGAAPKALVHTLFAQCAHHWDDPCVEPAVLVGAAAMFGKYGCYDALCEWSVWAQFNVRF